MVRIIDKAHSNFLKEVSLEEGFVLLVNKPIEWTSFDVVAKLRTRLKRFYQRRKIKVGHAGTLDPLATGLLIIAVGKATKRISTFQMLGKYYRGEIQLGYETETYDSEAPRKKSGAFGHIDDTLLSEAASEFTGEIMQVPPMYSAIKKDGQALYKLARKGKTVDIEPRPVQITRFDTSIQSDGLVYFEVECSKGTYIRSLAYDLGRKLGCGAYLAKLVRAGIGPHRLENAWELNNLIDYIDSEIAERHVDQG